MKMFKIISVAGIVFLLIVLPSLVHREFKMKHRFLCSMIGSMNGKTVFVDTTFSTLRKMLTTEDIHLLRNSVRGFDGTPSIMNIVYLGRMMDDEFFTIEKR